MDNLNSGQQCNVSHHQASAHTVDYYNDVASTDLRSYFSRNSVCCNRSLTGVIKKMGKLRTIVLRNCEYIRMFNTCRESFD